jgi:histidinol-phosphate aminotransferase
MNPHPLVERIRVPLSPVPLLEMHRNTRVDPYSPGWLNDMLRRIGSKPFHRYPDIGRFHTLLASFLNVQESQLLITSGVDGALRSVFESLTHPGDTVVFMEPTYMMYHIYAQAYRVWPETIVSDSNFNICAQDVVNKLASGGSMLFLANPHEPVENVFSLGDLENIVSAAAKFNTTILIDEAYYGFGAETTLPLLKSYKNLLIARSFSKTFGLPSIRLGCLIGSPELIARMNSRRLAYETNTLSMAVAEMAIDQHRRFEGYTRQVTDNRLWFSKILADAGFITHGKLSNTILVKVGDSQKVAEELKRRGIQVRPGPHPAEAWISVAIGSKEAMRKFLTSLKACCKTIARLQRA